MTTNDERRLIRIGVLGLSRGATYAKDSSDLGIQLVAVCDMNEKKLRQFKQSNADVEIYTDYDRFLEHDMDAVVVANYFHQHAPFAIKALRAGKHVMSETAACKTVQEGVQLCRAVEETGNIYMFAENYPYFSANQEMRKLYQQGVVGEVRYAEGEYVHPMPLESSLAICPGLDHWRANMPPTYYCTHALAPLMYMTDTMPVCINALSIVATPEIAKTRIRKGDTNSVILCRMDNGAVFRLIVGALANHRNYYRLHGTKARVESSSGYQVQIARNEWELGPNEHETVSYKTKFPSHAAAAIRTGHNGGDFWTRYHFAEAIRSGEQPYLNVYRAVAMSVVGILAWKSALQNGAPFEMPDFRDEQSRKLHENDDWSPWPEDRRPGQPWPSILGEITPSDEALAYAKKVWAKLGYEV
jgi:predicted dehydrogenase